MEANAALLVQSQQKVQPQAQNKKKQATPEVEGGGRREGRETMMCSAVVRGAVTRTVGVECWPAD